MRSEGADVRPAGTSIVLSIDDSATVRHFIELAMRYRPHVSVLGAETGESGIQLAREHLPSLILLDGSLPDIRGIEVLRTLKGSAVTEGIPIIVLTGSGHETYDEFLEAGADGFMVKPVELDDLFALVDRHARPGDPGDA
jgi:DNA-binding response OmpR family regulator